MLSNWGFCAVWLIITSTSVWGRPDKRGRGRMINLRADAEMTFTLFLVCNRKHTIFKVIFILSLEREVFFRKINKSDWSRKGITITNNVGNTHLMIMLWQYYTARNSNWYPPLSITVETNKKWWMVKLGKNAQGI